MHFNKFLIGSCLLLCSCGYPSNYEANQSCSEWQKGSDSYKGIIKAIKQTNNNDKSNLFLFKDTINTFSLRKCQDEKETKQVLGLILKNRVAGQTYIFNESQRLKDLPNNLIDLNLDWEVDKRFRY